MAAQVARYRYLLTREIAPLTGNGTCLFVMLNPSTADERADDPTIRKLKGFGSRWNVARIEVVNLFAVRSTDPSKLREFEDPVGPENDAHIAAAAKRAARIVVAWGGSGLMTRAVGRARARAVLGLLGAPLSCLGTTEAGWPLHPLYLPYHTHLRAYRLP